MKKKLISVLLAILFVVSIMPAQVLAATYSGKWGSNITWKLSGHTLTISGKGAMMTPDEDNYPPWWFAEAIEKIVIKDGVTVLPDFIFLGVITDAGTQGTCVLENVNIPASVKEISPYAFEDCTFLRDLNIDPDNPYISYYGSAVYNKEQTDLLFVLYGSSRFEIPKTVERINIESILEHPSISTFVVEEGNPVFESYEGGLYHKPTNTLILVGKRHSGEYNVKEGTKAIAAVAFYSCKEIWEIGIPEGVSVIEQYSFYDCQSLRTIHLPSTITSIGEESFGECAELKDVYFSGTKEMWEKIAIGEGNENLLNANIHFYCDEHADFVEVYAAYCTKPQLLKCSECAYTIVGDPPLGHSELVEPAIEATCTEYGRTESVSCVRCNNVLVKTKHIHPLDHDNIPIPAVEPTCTATGLTEGTKCSRCDEIFVAQQIVPTKDHTGEWTITKPATQTEDGIKERTCIVCGEVESKAYSFYTNGDVNGDGKINALDATQILRYANNKSFVLTNMDDTEKYGRADVNSDGKINALDATQILRFANNKSSVLTK